MEEGRGQSKSSEQTRSRASDLWYEWRLDEVGGAKTTSIKDAPVRQVLLHRSTYEKFALWLSAYVKSDGDPIGPGTAEVYFNTVVHSVYHAARDKAKETAELQRSVSKRVDGFRV